MGYRALLPLAKYGLRGGLPAQFDRGHSEICASLLPEGADQWRNFHFKCLPCWAFPFPPVCCLTNLLQCAGIGHKPVWFPHTLRHFFLGHELSDVEGSWGGQANILSSNLNTPSPCHEEVLGQQQSCTFCPRCQGDDQLILGHTGSLSWHHSRACYRMSSPCASAGPAWRYSCLHPACEPISRGTHGDWQRCEGACLPHHTAQGRHPHQTARVCTSPLPLDRST